MRGPNTRPSRASQAFSLTLACAFVAAIVAQSVHSPELEHAVCADHGELIHVGATGHQLSLPADVADTQHESGAHGDHEHCTIHTVSRELVAPASVVLSTVVHTGNLAQVDPDTEARVTAALYRIAPKNSPPVAG